jgi:hypothetical protein
MKPNYAIFERRDSGGYTSISIDTAAASFKGLPWRELGDFGKRKFENLLILELSGDRLKIRYV